MSDLAKVYPSGSEPAGFAADPRPETARQYGAGKELASAANGSKAHPGNANLAR